MVTGNDAIAALRLAGMPGDVQCLAAIAALKQADRFGRGSSGVEHRPTRGAARNASAVSASCL